jgi:HK97 gp10 family phage protein
MAGSFAKISGHGAVLDTSVLDRITAEMKPKAMMLVNKYGMAITGEAASNAPLDTGALRNSILSESAMSDELTFTVSDGVEYGVYQEFGTSKMAAQPFMIPAIEAWKERFLNAFSELFK